MVEAKKRDRQMWRRAIGGVMFAAVLFSAGTVRAEPGTITWTTYLYQGPSTHYQVADEVLALQRVDILGCANGWCHVSFEGRIGYVLAEVVVHAGENPAAPPPGVLAQPAASLEPNPRGPCFKVNEMGGNGGNELTQICQK